MNDQPSRFYATPAQIDAYLREHFAEDVLLHFYNTLGDEVLDRIRQEASRFKDQQARQQAKHVYLAGASDVMEHVWDNRYYPGELPDMSSYTRPHKTPPKHSFTQACGSTKAHNCHRYVSGQHSVLCPGYLPGPATAPEPQDSPCYRKNSHEPHDWLKGRKKSHCPGYAK